MLDLLLFFPLITYGCCCQVLSLTPSMSLGCDFWYCCYFAYLLILVIQIQHRYILNLMVWAHSLLDFLGLWCEQSLRHQWLKKPSCFEGGPITESAKHTFEQVAVQHVASSGFSPLLEAVLVFRYLLQVHWIIARCVCLLSNNPQGTSTYVLKPINFLSFSLSSRLLRLFRAQRYPFQKKKKPKNEQLAF